MFTSRPMVAIFAMLIFTGCGVGSLHPVFPESAARYDARLLGTWISKDNESVTVASDNSKDYTVILKNAEGRSGRFVARLGSIGGHSAIDVQPDKSLLETASEFRDLLLPMHTVFLLDSIGAELRVRAFDPDSLEALLQRDPTAIEHVQIGEMKVLTANSKDVQTFLTNFVNQRGVVGDATVFVRKGVSLRQ